SRPLRILFGHWARLEIKRQKGMAGVIPLDTGCANGGRFTALRLEDLHRLRMKCKNRAVPWKRLETTGR
ncbi:MAG TPA: hypothetical protein VET88_04980, partial [Gammaproteobacteria bacterium]|nr:hypothetical protein [Gammaproteobacteria bacterium]